MAGGRNKKNFNKSNSRKPTKSSLFVEGGLLSDWSPVTTSPHSRGKSNNSNSAGHKYNDSRKKSASRYEIGNTSGGKSKASGSALRMIDFQKPKKNAFAYKYPQVSPLVDECGDECNKLSESNPIVLINSKESKVIAFIDQGPVTDSETVTYSYDYGASFEVDDTSHIGLGFHDEAEENPSIIGATPITEKIEYSHFNSSSSHEIETDMMDDDDDDASFSQVTNSGFLSIGGMKLYTQDITYATDDDDDDDNEEEEEESSDSEDSCNSSDSDGAYNSDSDIDDEIAKDYFEGIGGSYTVANVDQLIGQILDSSDEEEDDNNGGCFSQMLKGVGGIALQDASREYGMKKPRSKNKSRAKPSNSGAATEDWSAIDDLMLVKNSRSLYESKRHGAKLSQSWPSKTEKSKNFQKFSGEKKKQRQDMIASKRRERRISHGVDLEKINFKLEQMVKNRGDMLSFQLMHSRDCSQVQRLAAIYRLQSGSQGSGRKRFVTVTRTRHTCMPSSSDRIRLEKTQNLPKTSSKKKRRDKDKTGSYAAQPVSFVSSGHMVSEPEKSTVGDHQTSSNNKSVAHSSSYGAFEMHTTGFGSRMMAKMGYVDGGGLGKDGRGISEPIEVIQRPKSLGLGAKIPDTSEAMNATPPQQKPNRLVGQGSSESKGKSGNVQFGSFEKHTKGFGSKMMAKMGFVEGMGLGRDSQGIVQPLVASRLPKSRGLGAKGIPFIPLANDEAGEDPFIHFANDESEPVVERHS
ncbi:hypothetical protein E3N88_46277 [Mikania micrantha]|uniref:G-patch domain-containing protein n=1 Tax=Mikania micrantha TaxID=192012 RepID=A0A5N6L707_9ASTR|nr:hypothetical protein E3N88_46277 [Mikania micrantha]